MMFTTLEGLTAEEQGDFEREQREAAGRFIPSRRARSGGRRERTRPALKRVLDFMQPGVAYTANEVMHGGRIGRPQLTIYAARGWVARTGALRHYRYARPA